MKNPGLTFWRTVSFSLLVALVLIWTLEIANVSAQAGAVIVPAAECTIEPLTEGKLVAIVADSVGSSEGTIAHSSLEGGPSATEINAIDAVVRMSVACANANQPMRSFALFSNRYLRERFGGNKEDDLGHLLAAITRTPAPAPAADQLALITLKDVELLPDGRISMIVVTSNQEMTFFDTIVFVNDGANWKIDEFVTSDSPATPAAAP